jgi:uncharacterized membrane protein YhhN
MQPLLRYGLSAAILYSIAVCAGIIYLLAVFLDVYGYSRQCTLDGELRCLVAVQVLSKPVVPVSLAIVAFLTGPSVRGKDMYGLLISVGLVVSAVADSLLVIPQFLIFGVATFAATQIVYACAFSSEGSLDLKWIICIPYYGFGFLSFLLFMPNIKPTYLALPVLLYILLECTMTWRATARVGFLSPRLSHSLPTNRNEGNSSHQASFTSYGSTYSTTHAGSLGDANSLIQPNEEHENHRRTGLNDDNNAMQRHNNNNNKNGEGEGESRPLKAIYLQALPPQLAGVIGAYCFMLSDSILALRLFVLTERDMSPLENVLVTLAIMLSYWLAQWLISLSVRRDSGMQFFQLWRIQYPWSSSS